LLLIGTLAVHAPVRAQLIIDKSQSVGAARRDSGTGACGTFINYRRLGTPPVLPRTRQDAEALLDRPATDTAIKGRVSRLVDRVNFRNGQTGFVEGDFTAPMYPDEFLPFSTSSMAKPPGDDVDIVMRLRGYFSVPSELAGKTLSFSMDCDDFCSLRIGQTEVFPALGTTGALLAIKQVRFPDAGLYPIELIYFQTAAVAYLEWAVADTAQPECTGNCGPYADKFTVMSAPRLYSAIVGESKACSECGAPDQSCPGATYCGDGLCQECNLPDHCGSTCMKCPAEARICSFGKCAECTADDQCPLGKTCDEGVCSAPRCCTRNDQCPTSRICNPDVGFCTHIIEPCRTDAMCPAGQICNEKGKCFMPPTRCTRDEHCSELQYCDLVQQLCRERTQSSYGGGCGSEGQGADTSGGEPLPTLMTVCRDGEIIPAGTKPGSDQQSSGCKIDPQASVRYSSSRLPLVLLAMCVLALSIRRLRRKRPHSAPHAVRASASTHTRRAAPPIRT
jgi:hypothetical protein